MKQRFRILLLMLMAMLPVISTAQVDLQRGLVAYYSFDGNANDESGNKNNGSIQGATIQDGKFGKCYHFGGYDNSQIIRIPNSNSLKFSDAVSFSFWFRLDDYVGMDGWGKKGNFQHMKFFAKDFDRGQICAGINGIDNNKFRIEICNAGKQCEAIINGNATKKWYHAVMILTTTSMHIYINGKDVASKQESMTFNNSNGKDLILGRLAQTWYPLHGCLDEFRIYNRVLNPKEVEALYQNATKSANAGDAVVMEYRDYKFFDDEPDYKLYEDSLSVRCNGCAYCTATQKLYVLDGRGLIVEYDITNAMEKKVGKRSFSLPFQVETERNTMEVSPNGHYLAFVDDNGDALHIVNTATGKEMTSAKLGKKYMNIHDGKSVGHPFAFLNDNEVLVSGMSKALLFNISKGKGKKLSFKKPYNETPRYSVTTRGQISGRVPGPDYTRITQTLNNGKLGNPMTNMYYGEFVNDYYYISTFEYGGHGQKDTYYDCKTGMCIDEQLAGSDRTKYTYKYSRDRKRCELTTINNQTHYLYFPNSRPLQLWLADYKILCLFTKDGKVQIYNHTLTGNEMLKQQLVTALSEKSIDAVDEFIAHNPKSRYVDPARQKRGECIEYAWKSLSQPNDYSPQHINDVMDFINKYASQANVDKARAELDNIYKRALERISGSDVDGFDNYVKTYPESPYIEQARQKQRDAYRSGYEELCRKSELQPYLDYVERYPNSPYIEDVKNRARTIFQHQQAEEQRLKAEEEARRQEEQRQRNAAKLNCVGKAIYWNEVFTLDISKGDEGLIGGLIGNALGTNRVSYTVQYTAIVEATLGETAVKCVISNVQILDPSRVSSNYITYKKHAISRLNEDLGKTRVKQLDEFELR